MLKVKEMAKKFPKPKEPTEAELAILNLLWRRGPMTVRQVHELLLEEGGTRYTTTLKKLQVMIEKGLVERDDSSKSHVYSAVIEESGAKRKLVDRMIDHVFDGSLRKMMIHALDSRDVDSEELKEIKRLLAEREKRK